MSLLDKVVAAVTPPESEKARIEARTKAHGLAEKGSWFALALEHHDVLRAAFTQTRNAEDAQARTSLLRQLAVLLLGHAQAEESVLYPALAAANEKAHAEIGYNEQALVKMQMALLETLPPMSQEFMDKLDHIEGAVLHHMYEEEGTWFPELREKGEAQVTLTRRYKEEFERYVG
jgi:hemerythrin superfamily protein